MKGTKIHLHYLFSSFAIAWFVNDIPLSVFYNVQGVHVVIGVCLRCISFTESLIDDDYGDDDK